MKFPRFRVTVELLEHGSPGWVGNEPLNETDTRLGVYMADQNRIAGDVWLNSASPRHSFDVSSAEFTVTVGYDANNIRGVQDFIARERERKS